MNKYLHCHSAEGLNKSGGHNIAYMLKHAKLFIVLATKKSRMYFTPEATKEIWQEFGTKLRYSNEKYYYNLTFLCLLLPHNNISVLKELVPSIMSIWNMAPKDNKNCNNLCNLLSRICKHSIGHIDFVKAGYLNSMMSTFYQYNNFPINSYDPQALINFASNEMLPYNPTDFNKQFAKVIVYSLHNGSYELLNQYFASIKTFYQPTNSGRWSQNIGDFINALSKYYARRVGIEKQKLNNYDSKYFINLDDEKFIILLRDIALTALFSKNTSLQSSCASVLRNLSYFKPEIILPKALDVLYPVIESKTNARQLMPAIFCINVLIVPILNRNLWPSGANHLQTLMELFLPGIDSLDPFKTLGTLTFYQNIFINVPFIDANDKDEQTVDVNYKQVDESARETTFFFKDWCSLFMNAIIKYFSNQTKAANKKENQQQTLSKMTIICRDMLKYFFSCLSKDIFTSVANLIIDYIVANAHLQADEEFGVLIAEMCRIYPSISLQLLVTKLANKITGNHNTIDFKSYNFEKIAINDTKMEWYLFILASAFTYAGGSNNDNTLVEFNILVKNLFMASQLYESKAIKKQGIYMVQCYLSGLTSLYPLEFRGFTSSYYSSKPQSYKDWSLGFELERYGKGTKDKGIESNSFLLNIQWHNVTELKISIAKDIINEFLPNCISTIRNNLTKIKSKMKISKDTVANENTNKKSDTIEDIILDNMNQVTSYVKGINSALGSLSSHYPDDAFSEILFDPTTFHLNDKNIQKPNLRILLMHFIIELFEFLESYEEDFVGLSLSIMNLLKELLCVEGNARRSELHLMGKISKQIRHVHARKDLFNKAVQRPYLIDQHVYIVNRLLVERTMNMDEINEVKLICDHLINNITSDYAEIRKNSMMLLLGLGSRLGDSLSKRVVNYSIDRIQNSKKEKKEALLGIYDISFKFLRFRDVGKNAYTSDLDTILNYLLSIVQYGADNDSDKVQSKLNQGFIVLMKMFIAFPITKENDANKLLEAINKVAKLLDDNGNKKIVNKKSWRSNLMALCTLVSFITMLANVDSKYNKKVNANVIMIFANGLSNPIPAYRTICSITLAKILSVSLSNQENSKLKTISIKEGHNIIDKIWQGECEDIYNLPLQYASNNDMSKEIFIDDFSTGSSKNATYFKTNSVDIIDNDLNKIYNENELNDQFKKYMVQNFAQVVTSYVESRSNIDNNDHGTKKENSGSFGAQIEQIFQSSLDFIYSYRCHYNFAVSDNVSITSLTKQFQYYYVVFWRSIFIKFPEILLEANVFDTIKHLIIDIDDNIRVSQNITAAEILAGICQAIPLIKLKSVHLEFEDKYIPLITLAIEKAQNNTSKYWNTFVSLSLMNIDPRRIMPLIRTLISECFKHTLLVNENSSNYSPLNIQKYLSIFRKIILELGWKGNKLYQKLLKNEVIRNGMINWLKSSYTVVCEMAIRIISDMMEFMSYDPKDAQLIKDTFISYFENEMKSNTVFFIKSSKDMDSSSDVDNGSITKMVESKDQNLIDSILGLLLTRIRVSPYDHVKDIFLTLTPYILRIDASKAVTRRDKFREKVKLCVTCIEWFAFPYFKSIDNEEVNDMTSAINAIKNASFAIDWSIRKQAATVLKYFTARNAFTLNNVQLRAIYKMCMRLIVDVSIEVRYESKNALLSLFLSTNFLYDEKQRMKMIRRLKKLANTVLPKTRQKKAKVGVGNNENTGYDDNDYHVAIGSKHGGILGLSAIIECFPYSLPSFLPEILHFVALKAFDPEPIRGYLRKLFRSFKTTHASKWDNEFSKLLTKDQLQAINDVEVAPSYFG